MAEGEEGTGFKIQSIASLLKAPIVAFIVTLVLFGPVVITSLMKTFSFVPFHIWVVLFVIFFIYRALK